jgi:hypothetical protein
MIDLDKGDELPSADEYLNRVVGYRGGDPQNGAMPGNGLDRIIGYNGQAPQYPLPDDEAQQNRVSVGQRIGGAIKPQAAPAQTAEAPQVKPPFDPNLVPESIRPRTMPPPDQIARPPVGVNSQRRLDLMAEESKLNKPTDPGTIDPSTGKAKYRMGWGQRLLGALSNAATGFSGRGGPSVYVGPGATNWKYDREENLRGQRLAGVQSDLSEQEKLEASQERSYSDAVKQSYDAAMADARRQLGLAAEENAGTRASLADSQRQLNLARAGKLDASPSEQRAADADKYGLRGEARTDYILTGRLPKEMMGNGRQPTELETWMTAFRRDNGREPSADEIANRRSRQSSKADQIEKDKDTALARAEQEAKTQLGKLDISAYTKDSSKSPGETPSQWRQRRQQEIYADLEKNKGQIQQNYETRAAANANAGRRAPGSVSAPQRIAPPQKPTQPAPAGRVWVYDKKTGTRGHIPASQLKSATSGTNAQYGTW